MNHNLLYNQISRLKLPAVSTEVEEGPIKLSPQTERLRITLSNNYPVQKLYLVTENIMGATPLDLSAITGTWVAVIKEKDPTGETSRWFVDNGKTQGFIPSRCLKPLRHLQQRNENRAEISANRSPTPDLMSLDSPVKESTPKLETNSSQSLWYMNLSKESKDSLVSQSVDEPIKVSDIKM